MAPRSVNCAASARAVRPALTGARGTRDGQGDLLPLRQGLRQGGDPIPGARRIPPRCQICMPFQSTAVPSAPDIEPAASYNPCGVWTGARRAWRSTGTRLGASTSRTS